MRIAFFSAKTYERDFFEAINNQYHHQITYFKQRLSPETAHWASGFPVVCCHVNDQADATTLQQLADGGTKLLALRSAGYNHVDLETASSLGIMVTRVPDYSPNAIAEHAVGLMLTLNRKIHWAHQRVQNNDLSVDGLMGFDLCDQTVGVVGTGSIGQVFADIMLGFGCRVIACSRRVNRQCQAKGVEYMDMSTLCRQSDIISLHCALTEDTYHLISQQTINQLKPGAMLINTSRGAVIDTQAALEGLYNGQIGSLGLDVYEHEAGLFFRDWSSHGIPDPVFNQLKAMPNVLITSHQAYITKQAIQNIAHTALAGIKAWQEGRSVPHTLNMYQRDTY